MAQYGEHYRSQTDEYGYPVPQTNEYGTPVHHTGGGTMGQHGTTGTGHGGMQYGITGTGVGGEQHGGIRRSGSSSSSSSEDDGHGGRRKKGLKEKNKEKIPGGHKENEPAHGTATGYGYGHEGEHQEKKGIMNKIQENFYLVQCDYGMLYL